MDRTQQDRDRRYRASPKGQFSKQRQNAAARGVEFLLTFDAWWGIWQKSGHWAKRGSYKGRYCMCRRNDEGAYAKGNVYIGTWSANTAERNRVVAVKKHTARTTTVTFNPEGITATISDAGEAPF